MIVLDTNVISENFRLAPDPAVTDWFRLQRGHSLFTTSISLGEILFGIETMPQGRRRDALANAVDQYFEAELAGYILSYDEESARIYSRMLSSKRRSGLSMSQADAQIAAIVRRHGATLATRNISDFEACGIPLVNPWTELL